jgi:hypothetical protein
LHGGEATLFAELVQTKKAKARRGMSDAAVLSAQAAIRDVLVNYCRGHGPD